MFLIQYGDIQSKVQILFFHDFIFATAIGYQFLFCVTSPWCGVHESNSETPQHIQKCVNAQSDRTLDIALLEEKEADGRAARLKSVYARSLAMFSGWKVIPNGVRIIAGPTNIRVRYPTSIKSLPSIKSGDFGGYKAESPLKADCLVVDPKGGLWAVVHFVGGDRGYLNADDLYQININHT